MNNISSEFAARPLIVGPAGHGLHYRSRMTQMQRLAIDNRVAYREAKSRMVRRRKGRIIPRNAIAEIVGCAANTLGRWERMDGDCTLANFVVWADAIEYPATIFGDPVDSIHDGVATLYEHAWKAIDAQETLTGCLARLPDMTGLFVNKFMNGKMDYSAEMFFGALAVAGVGLRFVPETWTMAFEEVSLRGYAGMPRTQA